MGLNWAILIDTLFSKVGYYCVITVIFFTYSLLLLDYVHRVADIQGVSGGIVNILGGGSMDYSE